MAGKPFIQIENLDELAERYQAGASIEMLCQGTDFPVHTLRRRFVKMGIMRSPKMASKVAWGSGRMNDRKTRAGVPQSEEAKRKQSESLKRRHDATARGWRITSSGYVEYTRGEYAGRSVHVVKMEQRIGRRLRPDEVVHHIDGNRKNNDEDNLALMTRAAHSRLHRREEALSGNFRKRDTNGQFERKPTCSN